MPRGPKRLRLRFADVVIDVFQAGGFTDEPEDDEAQDEAEEVTIAAPGGGGAVLDECTAAVVDLLRRAGHRLTTAKVIAPLEDRFGEATLKRRLAAAVRGHVLTTDGAARPPGYGLPEWD